MIGLINKKLKKLDKHTRDVIEKSFYSTIVRVLGIIFTIGVSVGLGRLLGTEGIGIINLGNHIINLLLIFCMLGMQQVIIKEVAIAHKSQNLNRIKDVIFSAFFLNGGITLVLTIILILLAPWLASSIFKEPELEYPLIILLIAVTPQIASRIIASGLIGYHKIWQSNLVEKNLSVGITGAMLFVLWVLGKKFDVITIAILYAIGRIAVSVLVNIFWQKIKKYKGMGKNINSELIKTSFPIFISTVFSSILKFAPTLILGVYASSSDVGIYTVAFQISVITSFFLQITNSVISPKIAAFYAQNNIVELSKMIRQVTRALLVFGLLCLIIFVCFGTAILGIWGDDFKEGYWVLVILSIGQFINLGTGAVSIILVMTGFEKLNRNITVLFSLLSLVLLFIFVSTYGLYGAAIVSSLCVIGLNISKFIYVHKKIRIKTI